MPGPDFSLFGVVQVSLSEALKLWKKTFSPMEKVGSVIDASRFRDACHYSEIAWLAYYDEVSVPGAMTQPLRETGEKLERQFRHTVDMIKEKIRTNPGDEVESLNRFHRKMSDRASLLGVLLSEGVDRADEEAKARLEKRLGAGTRS